MGSSDRRERARENVGQRERRGIETRAATIWGGVPRVELKDVGGGLDENISAYLLDKAST
ncbi:MAG: hypothetical protein HWN70_11805 [Desulfobacterales bacterium]|nr:hypothetical protein [Desulfobacterales bacterium]